MTVTEKDAEMERLRRIEKAAREVATGKMASDEFFKAMERLDAALGISPDEPIGEV